MKKKPSISRLKKKLWEIFSKWVRLRDADIYGIVGCVTCGKRDLWVEMQAGHFIHGHSKVTFLDERNVHPQCVKCNHYLSGNLIEYSEFMRRTYGQDTIDALREIRHQIWKPSRQELEELIEHYKGLIHG